MRPMETPSGTLVCFNDLSLGYFLLVILLLPSFPVFLNHLGQFPRNDGTASEDRYESQRDGGQEAVGVFGDPLDHIVSTFLKINHTDQQSSSSNKPENHQEKEKVETGRMRIHKQILYGKSKAR